MPTTSVAFLERQLEQLKQKLAEAVAETDSFVDPKVIGISQEMDELIVQLQRQQQPQRRR